MKLDHLMEAINFIKKRNKDFDSGIYVDDMSVDSYTATILEDEN